MIVESAFVERLRNLTVCLNSLPSTCTPLFLLNPLQEHEVRQMAQQLPQGMDHDNLSGSALVLALLRPHLYMDNPVPLRLFGYPAPVQLLAVDANPRSGGGPDNKRTNLLEALCFHMVTLPDEDAARTAWEALQDAWHVMRLRVDIALRQLGIDRPVSAHRVIAHALQVHDNNVML